MKKIKWSKLIDDNEEIINDYIQDSFWSEDFSTARLEIILTNIAEDEGYQITDDGIFDVDSELYNIYQITEKRLS